MWDSQRWWLAKKRERKGQPWWLAMKREKKGITDQFLFI
jgi:hypothetical protein